MGIEIQHKSNAIYLLHWIGKYFCQILWSIFTSYYNNSSLYQALSSSSQKDLMLTTQLYQPTALLLKILTVKISGLFCLPIKSYFLQCQKGLNVTITETGVLFCNLKANNSNNKCSQKRCKYNFQQNFGISGNLLYIPLWHIDIIHTLKKN